MFFSGFVSTSKAAGGPPSLTVGRNSATNVSQTSATLNAVINPRGFDTDVTFKVSKDIDLVVYTEHTAEQSPVSGSSSVVVSAQLSTLQPATKYYYQVIARSRNAIVKSPIMEVETL